MQQHAPKSDGFLLKTNFLLIKITNVRIEMTEVIAQVYQELHSNQTIHQN